MNETSRRNLLALLGALSTIGVETTANAATSAPASTDRTDSEAPYRKLTFRAGVNYGVIVTLAGLGDIPDLLKFVKENSMWLWCLDRDMPAEELRAHAVTFRESYDAGRAEAREL